VLGEGAAMFTLEPLTTATERGATVLAEILGYGMSTDADVFVGQNLDRGGLRHAAGMALDRAEVAPEDVGLIIWAPMGNATDLKVVDVAGELLGARAADVPMVTTTFNTGHSASASILFSLAAALEAIHGDSEELWPQRTGLAEIDDRTLQERPRVILALASSDEGYNFATVFGTEAPASTSAEAP